MKKVTLLIAALATLSVSAQEVELVVEQVDNGGVVDGHTFRLYAQMPTADHSLHAVFGGDENPIHIEATAPFYQHPYGGNTSRDVSEQAMGVAPELRYDSYLTIGRTGMANNELWEVNIDFDSFNDGAVLDIPDGAWFLIPTSDQTSPEEGDLILLAQFTTAGNVSGTLNLQGWTGPQQVWQKIGATFSTNVVDVLGCTDSNAANYNAAATVDDGSCDEVTDEEVPAPPSADTVSKKGNDWSIFPNPVMNGQINIQFSDVINPESDEHITISIFEVTGKLVMSEEVGAASVIGGNRIILNADLAAGSYQVAVQQGDVQESQQIIVQ